MGCQRSGYLEKFDPEAKLLQDKDFDQDDISDMPLQKVLGMTWDCNKDSITFRTRVSAETVNTPMKVRHALKLLASTYDPRLGHCSLCTEKWKKIWQDIIVCHRRSEQDDSNKTRRRIQEVESMDSWRSSI